MPLVDRTLLARLAEVAMVERGFLPHAPADALAEAARSHADVGPVARAPDPAERDLRDLPWTSIDNPESTDLDQIEAAEPCSEGTRLYVGIADVAHFVRPGGALDGFASNNTTSVYTGVRTFPMLPDELSSGVSSLLGGVERRAVVVETVVRPDGTLGDARVSRAIVQNRGKLAYPSVSAWLDGHAPPPAPLDREPALRAQVELHDQLARALAEARRRDGALDVDTAEIRPRVDDLGEVVALEEHRQDRAGRIVAELMIATNRSVAAALERAGIPSIRRVVKEPERWARIVEYAAERGASLPATPSSRALAGFVDTMRRTRAADFAEISLAIVKLMGRGRYVAHRPGEPEVGHFGLAATAYTHATAPNRRYADLVTQRLLLPLAGAARPSPGAVSSEALDAVADRCTRMESEAQKVTRRVHKSAAAAMLERRVGERFDAIVTGSKDSGVFVRTAQPVVEGKLVHGGAGLAVGDRVRVRLASVSVERGYIDFEPAT